MDASHGRAVPRRIYAAFAACLAGRRNIVVTYDRCGIGGSKPTMQFNDVGPSFGAQALGLLPNNTHVSRALFRRRTGRRLGRDDRQSRQKTSAPKRIGHLGFFCPEKRDLLWKDELRSKFPSLRRRKYYS